jgi:photosystem I P700 chlorophyll a apoprotein A1
MSKGPKQTSWIWDLHANAHDFDEQAKTIEDVSRKVFSAHFGQLSVIFIWLSQAYFHGAKFSNYSAWLENPTTVVQSSQVVWRLVGQEILNENISEDFFGLGVTSGFFELWRGAGITTESQLFWTSIGSLIMALLMGFAGWFHYHKRAPRLAWFQKVESMLNHHLAGLLGLGCLAWSGHQIHISLPVNALLDSGVSPYEIPAPLSLLKNEDGIMSALYPSFKKGLVPFFSLNWNEYADFLTFKGGLNPVTGGLWLTDQAHHHLAISVLFLIAGHMYRTNWKIGHSIKEILDAHVGGFLTKGQGHRGLFEILTTSWHAQLALNLAMMGSLSIVVAHHMYAMPPYPYIGIDYPVQLSLFVHHLWIGGILICGAGAHAAIFMVRDYDPVRSYNTLLDRVLQHRETIISHLSWLSTFLGVHSFGLYVHNDTLAALGRATDMFADGAIELSPIFANGVQLFHVLAPGTTAPNQLSVSSYIFGGGAVLVDGAVSVMPIDLGTADFMIHHIHAFTLHVSTLILLKGALLARSSQFIPDKGNFGFRFPCDGPGRGGTCQVSGWDHVFLGLFWMYNATSITIFHFAWELGSDVWGTLTDEGTIETLYGGSFATDSLTVNGWLGDYLWAGSYSVVSSYGTAGAAYGLIFLTTHFTWAFSLMFLFSGRGYWQELIESILWCHSKMKLEPKITPLALSITQGRAVGLAHFLLGGVGTTWSFLLSNINQARPYKVDKSITYSLL